MRSDRSMSFVSELFATTDAEKLRELGTRKILRRALTAKDLVAIGLGTLDQRCARHTRAPVESIQQASKRLMRTKLVAAVDTATY